MGKAISVSKFAHCKVLSVQDMRSSYSQLIVKLWSSYSRKHTGITPRSPVKYPLQPRIKAHFIQTEPIIAA